MSPIPSQGSDRMTACLVSPSWMIRDSFNNHIIHGKKAPAADAALSHGIGFTLTLSAWCPPIVTAINTKYNHNVAVSEASENI
jgi:hypothetical protein